MNPPTPYPVSARSKPKIQNDLKETAFREITARANTISKSVQDSFTGIKKMEEEQTGKGASKTPTCSRRYSVASKFAGPKGDNMNIISNGASALQPKHKLNKRASFQGVNSELQVHGTFSKSTAAPSSKSSIKGTTLSSLQGDNPGTLHRRQSLAFAQTGQPQKLSADLLKRSAPGYGKSDSTQAHTNKARGMLLKSAFYWMEQVKLAEMMGKSGVSIGFFRLAVECEAEPIEHLREQLIAFIERNSLWSETIQQLLLCYGVSTKDQETLYSQLAASGAKKSSPCDPGKIYDSNKEFADQALEQCTKNLAQNFNSAMGKDPAEGTTKVSNPDEAPVLGVTGHIGSMDAESITREVVLCIMSSMNHSDGCSNGGNGKCHDPKTDLIVSSEQKNHYSSAADSAANCAVSIHESISNANSAFLEEATSSESLPSLSVWNTMPKDTASCGQEEVTLILDNDIIDSSSTTRVSGEDMCVSMDVVDTLSDDLQSNNPAPLSSKESDYRASQTTGEVYGNVREDLDATRNSDEAMSSGEMHVALPQSIINSKGQNKASGKVQTSERIGSEPSRGHKSKNAYSRTNVELPSLQMTREPETQGSRRMSHGIKGGNQKLKEKSAPVSDKTKKDSPTLSIDKTATSAPLSSRRLSLSTPRSSHTPNLSRTRSKGRLLQATEQASESQQMQLTNPVTDSEGTVETPRHDRIVEDGDGSNQVSINIVAGMGMRTTEDTGSIATPGSAGVRRSARLVKPAGVSTPSSVTTPHLQRRLATPKA